MCCEIINHQDEGTLRVIQFMEIVGVTADVRVCVYVLSMPVSSVIVLESAFVSSVLLQLFLLRASR